MGPSGVRQEVPVPPVLLASVRSFAEDPDLKCDVHQPLFRFQLDGDLVECADRGEEPVKCMSRTLTASVGRESFPKCRAFRGGESIFQFLFQFLQPFRTLQRILDLNEFPKGDEGLGNRLSECVFVNLGKFPRKIPDEQRQ